jgi:hypothetical protein
MCICIHILGCVVFREGRDVYEYGLKLKSVNDTIGLMIQINISGAQLNVFNFQLKLQYCRPWRIRIKYRFFSPFVN